MGDIRRYEPLRGRRKLGELLSLAEKLMLNQSEQLTYQLPFQSVVEASELSCCIIDVQQVDCPIVYANPAFEQTTGCELAEIIGRPPYFLQNLPCEQALHLALADGQPGTIVVQHNGEDVWHEIKLTPIYDQHHNLTHFIAFLQEVPAPAKENDVETHFMSVVSHEFRTPLAAISTSVGLMRRYFDRLSPDCILEKLGGVEEQVQRLALLMEDALRYGKSEAGRTEYQPQSVPVRDFCQKIIDTCILTDENRHIIHLINSDGILWGDPALVDHILTNLLSNALKYSPEHTVVTMQVQHTSEGWQFQVQDQGIGIPTDELSELFQPFYRASNARQIAGTGLGLSIVKDYVLLHGGKIDVESTMGVGTTFTFILPD